MCNYVRLCLSKFFWWGGGCLFVLFGVMMCVFVLNNKPEKPKIACCVTTKAG